jgi:hypothetical protein
MELRRHGIKGVVAAGLLAIALTACGGGSKADKTNSAIKRATNASAQAQKSSSSSGGAGKSGCALVTTAEVATATGMTVKQSREDDNAALNGCRFDLDPGHASVVHNTVMVHIANLNASAFMQGNTGEPVSGLGDQARWEPTTSALSVLKGQHFVDVQVIWDNRVGDAQLAPDTPEMQAKQQAIATNLVEKALGRA